MHEAKIKIDNSQKQNKKFEEKIKDLTAAINSEKAKRNEEVKKLKSQMKSLMDEAEKNKGLNVISDEEVNVKVQILAEEMMKEMGGIMLKEKIGLLDQIEQFKQDLEMAKRLIKQREEDFEAEKVKIHDKLMSENNSIEMIKGTLILHSYLIIFRK